MKIVVELMGGPLDGLFFGPIDERQDQLRIPIVPREHTDVLLYWDVAVQRAKEKPQGVAQYVRESIDRFTAE